MLALGKVLLILGVALLIVGGLLIIGPKIGFTLGRLPGDIRVERNGGGLYLPLATSLLLSLILTVVLNVLLRILRK